MHWDTIKFLNTGEIFKVVNSRPLSYINNDGVPVVFEQDYNWPYKPESRVKRNGNRTMGYGASHEYYIQWGFHKYNKSRILLTSK